MQLKLTELKKLPYTMLRMIALQLARDVDNGEIEKATLLETVLVFMQNATGSLS